MTYQEQIKHPNWQKKRLEILERDNFTCQGCESKEKTLHVHHLIYDKGRSIWEYENNYLVTYCSDCHNLWHEIKEDIISIISRPDIRLILKIRELLITVKEIGGENIIEIIKILESINNIHKIDRE